MWILRPLKTCCGSNQRLVAQKSRRWPMAVAKRLVSDECAGRAGLTSSVCHGQVWMGRGSSLPGVRVDAMCRKVG